MTIYEQAIYDYLVFDKPIPQWVREQAKLEAIG